MSEFIWVQLYFEGKGKSKQDSFEIESTTPLRNVNALKEAVKEKRENSLKGYDAATLIVYKAGTAFPTEGENSLEPDASVPTDSTGSKPLRVVAPAKEQPNEDPSLAVITIKLKYKNLTEYKWVVTGKEGLTFVALTDAARKASKMKVAKLEFTHNGIDITKDTGVAGLNDGALVHVENRQVSFSSVHKIEHALKLVGQESSFLNEDNSAFPGPLVLDDSDDNVKHAIETIKRLQNLVPIVGGCEATRRLYIDPILCAAGLKVGDVTMTVEKAVEDARFNGDVDYLFSFNNIVICVTEGKKDQLDNGIAQNIAQLASVRANRKRKSDEISLPGTFGIATTFVEWVFIKYEDERVVRSTSFVVDPTNNDSITRIVGRISGLLKQCKSDAGGGQQSASRQRQHH